MDEKEKLELMKHSYSILKDLVKDINKRMADAEEGIKESNRNLIIGSLLGIDKTAEQLKNVFTVMEYLHQNKA
jgi:hypothetical protein